MKDEFLFILIQQRLVWCIEGKRWRSEDVLELRKTYSKNDMYQPHKWAHITVVVVFLHVTCFFQYALCAVAKLEILLGAACKYTSRYYKQFCEKFGSGNSVKIQAILREIEEIRLDLNSRITVEGDLPNTTAVEAGWHRRSFASDFAASTGDITVKPVQSFGRNFFSVLGVAAPVFAGLYYTVFSPLRREIDSNSIENTNQPDKANLKKVPVDHNWNGEIRTGYLYVEDENLYEKLTTAESVDAIIAPVQPVIAIQSGEHLHH
ncbi:hypothetical protein FCM35_KLT06611 [Carex littledalei]|uniref:Uncharacterized protein n=1 Tax=Carex littledalei TaxID=544730 RepID=A0A833VIL4_9POAL|nr:hypothetical protein FCM35_KLT06611 [Carex littledalei]